MPKAGRESSKTALLTPLFERLSRFHRFRGCTDVINGATECVTAYETLEHERKSRLRPHISMKFRRAAHARKFRNKFREILAWAKV